MKYYKRYLPTPNKNVNSASSRQKQRLALIELLSFLALLKLVKMYKHRARLDMLMEHPV